MISLELRPGTPIRLGWSRPELHGLLTSLLDFMGTPEADLELLVTDDAEIAEYNTRFLGLTGPTNVLSFPGAGPEPGGLGSLCLSAEAIAREAFLYRQPISDHLVRLLAHGILHLQGLPHGPEMDGLTRTAVERFGSEVQPQSRPGV